MATFRLDPPKPGLSSRQYRDYVKKTIRAEIKRLGVDGAMKHKDFVIFYSGPSGEVIYKIKANIGSMMGGVSGKRRNFKDNKKRSLEMAIEMGASRITDTQAAITLNGHDLTNYFKIEYSKIYSDPILIKKAVNKAYFEIWGGISELFSELNFSRVATAVCGAGQERIFIKDELPALVKNPYIQALNNVDMRAVRNMFNEVSPDEAFRLVCLAELRMSLDKANHGKVSKIYSWTDFFERQTLYNTERDLTTSSGLVSLLAPAQEKRRSEIIAKYGLTDLYDTVPAYWGGPIIPAPTKALSIVSCLGL